MVLVIYNYYLHDVGFDVVTVDVMLVVIVDIDVDSAECADFAKNLVEMAA